MLPRCVPIIVNLVQTCHERMQRHICVLTKDILWKITTKSVDGTEYYGLLSVLIESTLDDQSVQMAELKFWDLLPYIYQGNSKDILLVLDKFAMREADGLLGLTLNRILELENFESMDPKIQVL